MAASSERLFDVIRLLRSASTPLTLSAIAKALRIAPSSAHAILNRLVEESAITIDGDKRYRLGPALFYLGASYARNAPIHRAIWTELVHLALELDMAAALATPWAGHHLILAVHLNGGQVGVAVGSRVPLQAGSYGKAYYAWSGAKPPTALTRFTPQTISSTTEYKRELKRAREHGYATDAEQFVLGIGAVATAVTSDTGYEGLASLMGTSARCEEIGYARIGERLANLASRASVILGDRSRERTWGV